MRFLFIICLLWAWKSSAIQIGEQAPALHGEWIKGDPVAPGDGEHLYILEFWATWCKPCRDNFSHLTQIQRSYENKGVIVVAISNESASEVASFVKLRDDKMGYRVFTDESGETNKLYTKGTPKFYGIPFVVLVSKEGKVAWFDTGIEKLEPMLNSLLDGSYNESAVKKSVESPALYQEYWKHLNEKNDAEASRVGEALIQSGDSEVLLRLANKILKLELENFLSNKELKQDLVLAQKAMEAALLLEPTNVSILSTYAEVLYQQKNLSGAIQYQEKAIAISSDKKQTRWLKRELRHYKKEQKRS